MSLLTWTLGKKEEVDAKRKEAKSTLRMWGMPLAIAAVFALCVAVPVQAGTLNDSVSPLIEDMAGLFVPILTLILAAFPVIIAGAFISFMLGILARILGMI